MKYKKDENHSMRIYLFFKKTVAVPWEVQAKNVAFPEFYQLKSTFVNGLFSGFLSNLSW